MRKEITIKSAKEVLPRIYAYTTPDYPKHYGWIKIGYTEKDVIERIEEQTSTADIDYILEWDEDAKYTDGTEQYFNKDYDFHAYLQWNDIERMPNKEWFKIDAEKSHQMFYDFAGRKDANSEHLTYCLRDEQEDAVSKTEKYFNAGGDEFLWNAKPRFGKTLAAYDLIHRMSCSNVLIVTNRPSIANSWWEDFKKFFYWKNDYEFVTGTAALKRETAAISRDEYVRRQKKNGSNKKMVTFVSLQDLKGSKYFGGKIDKLKWIAMDEEGNPFTFDLLIVDEAHEGVDTILTENAFEKINREHTLYLSGTPFKALAKNRFKFDQIYNWSYSDEQEAKQNWKHIDVTNPYDDLPQLAMFTYHLPSMIEENIAPSISLTGESDKSDFMVDLDEFFAADGGQKFVHEREVKAFIFALSHNEKFPFSTPELRGEMSHTLWLFSRINSCKAMKKLLNEDPIFKEYTVVDAYGSGKSGQSNENEYDKISKTSYERVKKAIRNHSKTITLSVGQLTEGVTIPQWSGILMLCNLRSASAYMQAAFRVQNPCLFSKNGKEWRKETAYVFDFDPARSLILYDEFANNLVAQPRGGRCKSEDKGKNIERLLKYFPVVGENVDGNMVELDARQVLSIPRKLKSEEVVSRGFLCNYLFQNISHVFSGSANIKKILRKLPEAKVGPKTKRKKQDDTIDDITVDENGDATISQKVVNETVDKVLDADVCYKITYEIGDSLNALFGQMDFSDEIKSEDVEDKIYESMESKVVRPVVEEYSAGKSVFKNIKKCVKRNIHNAVGGFVDKHNKRIRTANEKYSKAHDNAKSMDDIVVAEAELQAEALDARKDLHDEIQGISDDLFYDNAVEMVTQFEKDRNNKKKQTAEDDIRAHLRGFSRTIPSFLMAYGDNGTSLSNFGDNVDEKVFIDVTGITKKEFYMLRDEGKLFDEVVFNDSVDKFLQKKKELSNYFDESLDENIFDYIPPQKNNQIFTPKNVVIRMIKMLEKENPGCFDDDNKTFADLYMKSGLYITEIVKRLFNSEKMKQLHPDENERITHILTKQVYGMAPNEIIYRIATNYIFGFDKNLNIDRSNFVIEDTAKAVMDGTLEKVISKHFGKKLEKK